MDENWRLVLQLNSSNPGEVATLCCTSGREVQMQLIPDSTVDLEAHKQDLERQIVMSKVAGNRRNVRYMGVVSSFTTLDLGGRVHR